MNLNYKQLFKSFINDNKKYLLTEKKMTLQELKDKSMFPKLSKEGIKQLANDKTYLGNKLKEGDMLIYGLLQEKACCDLEEDGDFLLGNGGFGIINLMVISLTYDEIHKYKIINISEEDNIPTLALY